MYRKILIGSVLVLFGSLNMQAESSLFGPSKSEVAYQKLSVKNREQITELIRRINTLNERVYGLTTVVEGLNGTISELRRSQSAQPSSRAGDLSLLEIQIGRLSRECVTHKELDALIAARERGSVKKTSSTKSTAKSTNKKQNSGSSLSGKTNSALYSEGVRLFQKEKYSDARKRFVITEKKKHKPAASNYYLGEIAYYTKKYSDAIFYFKKSAGLYDQAGYIDTLLLHTAISLEKTGDKSQAKMFYQTIVEDYPEKKSAKIAKKKLNKL
ncbi:MAG: hypothetical protein U9R26_10510 [Campylobacterota bacterium]|nr:hypothetical protein [Campylobacterota bacterium]